MAIPAVGSELAGYRIDALIGRGGMGVVYRGTDLRLGRPVAIKLIAADRAGEPGMRERFEREARLMAAIDHPNVVPIYAAGEDDGCLYLVMRHVAGTDLARRLDRHGPLVPDRAVAIIEQLAGALDVAHAAGLIHRDIKPANVLLAGEHAFLSDFGLGRALGTASRLTDSHDWLGTVDFCSPEQLRSESVDPRSDVYSLGCLLHTALTGTPPHHRDTTTATMLAQLNDPAPPASATPGVPPELDRVLHRALAKHPEDRYGTAGALARAARAALSGRAPRAALSGRASAPELQTRPAHRAEQAQEDTVAGRTRLLPRALSTRLDLRPRRSRSGRSSGGDPKAIRRGLLVPVALLLAAAALVAVLTTLPTSRRPRPPRPLTGPELTRTVQSFARDYGDRDLRGLGALLAPGVIRADPASIERSRATVLAEFRSELSDSSIVGYRLSGLQLTPGWIGRVTARYAILRIARPTQAGQVSFAVERLGGRLEIVLVAIEPAA